jgi:hypothetical protein
MELVTEVAEPETGTGVKQQALALPDEARSIVIRNDADYQLAAQWLRDRCKAVLQRIGEVFDPIIAKAHEAHKEAVARKREVAAPVEEAERIVKASIAVYLREREREQLEAQRLAEQAARRLAEEEALSRAAALESAGRVVEAEEVISRPLPPPPIAAAPPPQASGVARRINYRAQVTDLRSLVRHVAQHPEHANLLLPNQPALNQLAKSLRGDLAIPGVRVVAEDVISARA